MNSGSQTVWETVWQTAKGEFSDLGSAADLRKMARDLESWANEAEFESRRMRRRPLLESSIALH